MCHFHINYMPVLLCIIDIQEKVHIFLCFNFLYHHVIRDDIGYIRNPDGYNKNNITVIDFKYIRYYHIICMA